MEFYELDSGSFLKDSYFLAKCFYSLLRLCLFHDFNSIPLESIQRIFSILFY